MSVYAIIPAYNADALIHKPIDSVLDHTTPVDEIIMVNDGSKDRTRGVVESYAPRVPLLQPIEGRYWMSQSLAAWPRPAWQPKRFMSLSVMLRSTLFTTAAEIPTETGF